MNPAEETYSLAVALFDFLPVLVCATGLWLFARALARRSPGLAQVGLAAALLIPLGGLCKASWKLRLAMGFGPLEILENLLFLCLAPGFLLLAFTMHRLRTRALTAPQTSLPMPLLLLALGLPWLGAWVLAQALPQGRAWFFWLLALTTLANLALVIEGIRCCRRTQAGLLPACSFALAFMVTLGLSGLARLPPTEASAWIQEGTNLLAQSLLAFGLWQLAKALGQPSSSAPALETPP